MNCENFICECKANCCSCPPIPAQTWWENQDKIVRPVTQVGTTNTHKGTFFIPKTESGRCPFLTEECRCNIYESRPPVCQRFGDESHHWLVCVYQRKDGSARFKRERERIQKKIAKKMNKAIAKIKSFEKRTNRVDYE